MIGKLGPPDFLGDEDKVRFAGLFSIFLQAGQIGPTEFTLYSKHGEQPMHPGATAGQRRDCLHWWG